MWRKIKNVGHAIWGWYWVGVSGYPAKDLVVVGVTGTDGKTTTATLIYEMLKAGGVKTGLITTVGAKIGEMEMDTGLHVTNPSPELLQPILKRMRDEGITHVVLEVTSHGLDQNRVVGCNFEIGVLTNISHEHLDYHKDTEEYVKAKAKLFRGVKWAVLNKNERWSEYMKRMTGGRVVEYGPTKLKTVSPALAGKYNRYNVGAAEAVAGILGVKKETVGDVVREFKGVVGRREEVVSGQRFRVVVDFAHTPHALESILGQMKKELEKGGKLTVVFGCPGKRDELKRPLMGKAAVTWADRVIITADDPRNDDMGRIFMMATGDLSTDEMKKVEREDERREAIKKALLAARAGDIVVLAGKGHERSLAVGDNELPWSDQEVARELLEKMV